MNQRVPPESTCGIGEASFADAIRLIEGAPDLRPIKVRHWSTSLRQIGAYLGRPLESIPARIGAVGAIVKALHANQLGLNSKTLANHKSNARAALLWLNGQRPGSRREGPMAPVYRALLAGVPDQYKRDLFSPFFRFLSFRDVKPTEVTGAAVLDYGQFRADVGFAAIRPSNLRVLVRHWNAAIGVIAGWPSVLLAEPSLAARSAGPAWDEFPPGLRADIDAHCVRISGRHKSPIGKTLKAAAKATVATRRRELVAAVRTGVQAGIPLASLKSLADLLQPENAEKILDAYWTKNGDEPSLYTIELAAKFYALALMEPCFDPSKLKRLEEMRDELQQHNAGGLTEKNRDLIRQVLQGDAWARVVDLPRRMMERARTAAETSPARASVSAELAVAIRILTLAPIRMQNLAAIRIGVNLVRPGGAGSPLLLTFPEYDVKNRIPLEFPLDGETTALIDEYVTMHRPRLTRIEGDYLFPTKLHDRKDEKTLGAQITKRLQKELGLRITPHQFRHAAAAIMLRSEPGNYELVRRVLGHRSINTTTKFYIGLESLEATRRFGEIVTSIKRPEQSKRKWSPAQPPRRPHG